jgi:ribose transport system substrate-binding protein
MTGPATIGLVVGVANEPFYLRMIDGATQKAQALGVKLTTAQPGTFSVPDQLPLVQNMYKKVSALVIAPVDKTQMIAPLKMFSDAGIPVITVDTYIGSNTYGQGGPADFPVAYIGSDNYAGGQIACDTLAMQINSTGKVYIQIDNMGVSSTQGRLMGCKDLLAMKYPNITVVATDYNGNSADMAKAQTQAMLTANPDLAGVFGCNVASGTGAGQGVAAAGKSGAVKVVVFDAPQAAVTLLKSNVVDALIAQKPSLMGSTGVDYAVQAVNGAKNLVPKVSTGFVVITRDNVNDPNVSEFVY